MSMINFRGTRLSDGQTIFGFYHERAADAYIDDWRVDPDSVAQLCGYDRNGDELYDGDRVLVDSKWDDCAELVARTASFDASFGCVTLKRQV